MLSNVYNEFIIFNIFFNFIIFHLTLKSNIVVESRLLFEKNNRETEQNDVGSHFIHEKNNSMKANKHWTESRLENIDFILLCHDETKKKNFRIMKNFWYIQFWLFCFLLLYILFALTFFCTFLSSAGWLELLVCAWNFYFLNRYFYIFLCYSRQETLISGNFNFLP